MTRFYLKSADKYYEIEEDRIWNFPIDDTFLQALLRQKMAFAIPMKDDAIMIETPLKYFQYIVDIYNNPTLLLSQILDRDFQDLMALFDRFDETTKYNDIHDWLAFQDLELLEQLKSSVFDESNYKEFIRELKYFGIWPLYDSATIHEEKICEQFNDRFPDKLHEKVLSIGGYISGSSLLNIVTGDAHWKSSDVDIYIHRNMLTGMFSNKKGIDFTALVNFFEGSEMEIITSNNPNFNHHYESYCDCLGNCIDNVLFVLKFKIGDLNVDLICVRIPVPVFIYNNFDFSFLKMYSDGICLHIFDRKSVLKRKATFNCVCFNTMKKRQRLQKYHERGFVITFNFQHRLILPADNSDISLANGETQEMVEDFVRY